MLLRPTAAILAGPALAVALSAMSSSAAETEGQSAYAAGGPDLSSRVELGRALFASHNCGGCHTLARAGAQGRIGPSLDRDPHLSEELVIERVSDGVGPMPGFFDKLSEDEIAAIAQYVVHTAEK